MSYADIRFQRIENNINELKESIQFLSDIMHDHLLDKKHKKNNDGNDDNYGNDDNDDNDDNENAKNNKTNKNHKKVNEKKENYLSSRLVEWVKSPSTIIYGTSIIIGAFTSYGFYHFYDKK
jgi:hypothetical protein